MVVKLYVSGISGNKEVKKKQQRVQMILDSKNIRYEAIDITEPGNEKDKEFMQQNGKVRESLGKHPLPPQIFNEDDYCGDYEDFDLANEIDELEKFLHIDSIKTSDLIENDTKVNGTREESQKLTETPDNVKPENEVSQHEVSSIDADTVGVEKVERNETSQVDNEAENKTNEDAEVEQPRTEENKED